MVYTPVLPDIKLGATAILSGPDKERCALNVALMVPESRRNGAASLPVGVIGAGSSAASHASVKMRVPYEGAFRSEMSSPKATYDKLNSVAKVSRRAVSYALTTPTELSTEFQQLVLLL
jgi:hypothetical protein